MNRKRRPPDDQMDGIATQTKANVYPIGRTLPALDSFANIEEKRRYVSWIKQRLTDLRVLVMPDTPTKPFWNTTMVTTWCAVISLILVLLGIVCTAAFTFGVMYNRMENLNERLKVAEADAEKAKTLEASRTGSGVGHPPEQK